jgi:hypothetical protein
MTIQEIKSIAPAVFTTSADPKMSKKYVCIDSTKFGRSGRRMILPPRYYLGWDGPSQRARLCVVN